MSLVGFVAVSGDRKGEETVMAEAEIMETRIVETEIMETVMAETRN